MKKIKPGLSKGTRDFLPREVAKRNYIFDTIKSVFRKYGFEEIETPAIEKLETLTGKYGDEGDKLLFKILNSGDYLKDAPPALLQNPNAKDLQPYIAEKGLRYDLTVPLARYVVMYQDKLAFPFKRFHIGPAWRADRPQKGRYQEFYQCDADIIGSTSMICEAELTSICTEVFAKFGFGVKVRINSRKLLEALAEYAGCLALFAELTVCIDKLDKIGFGGVKGELVKLGLSEEQIEKITSLLESNSLTDLTVALGNSEMGGKGLAEVNYVLQKAGSPAVEFDLTLARGLNYYTGIIWEVVLDKNNDALKNISMGSLCGGGRYDNLTEIFGGQNMSGVGISFGIERIYDVMEELNLFPEAIAKGVKVLFVPRGPEMEEFTFKQVQAVREAGISAEIFLGNVKKQKHFKYLEDKNIQYMVEVGSDEQATGAYRLRNALSRETKEGLSLEHLIKQLSQG
ncbi:MAG TPA: histidine--tRNA ligase [Chitinophagales bacterium]|nr:histidine--tRNA ligase [Chitinophagales bacterium]